SISKLLQHTLLSGDGVSSFVLRECPDAFTAQLTILLNLSLSNGEFPSSWREANIKTWSKITDQNGKSSNTFSIRIRIIQHAPNLLNN
ncbi:hypothetical protein BpHYR1_036610, partial [Brachionus plicatilis]